MYPDNLPDLFICLIRISKGIDYKLNKDDFKPVIRQMYGICERYISKNLHVNLANQHLEVIKCIPENIESFKFWYNLYGESDWVKLVDKY